MDYKLQTLRNTIDLLNEYEIKWFLTSGSLLGAVREHNFIEGDDDSDIGILRNETDRPTIDHLIADMLAKGYKKRKYIDRHVITFDHPTEDWHIDLWLFETDGVDYYHGGWSGYFKFPIFIDELVKEEFKGLEVYIPRHYNLILKCLYGNYNDKREIEKPNGYPNYTLGQIPFPKTYED